MPCIIEISDVLVIPLSLVRAMVVWWLDNVSCSLLSGGDGDALLRYLFVDHMIVPWLLAPVLCLR